MLSIEVNNQLIDLGKLSMNLEINNPLFSFMDGSRGQFSYPFTLPWTRKNKRVFKHGDLLESLSDDLNGYYDATIYLQGIAYLTGEIHLRSSNESSFKITFSGQTAVLSNTIGGTLLTDIDLGQTSGNVNGNSYSPTAYAKLATYGSYQDFDVAFFEVYNKDFPSDKYPNFTKRINYWKANPDGTNPTFQDNPTPTTTQGESYINQIVPFPYVFNTLRKSLAALGWTFTGSIADDAELNSLVFLNSFSINKNYFNQNTYDYRAQYPIKYNNHTPSVQITTLIKKLSQLFCCLIDIDTEQKTISLEPIKDYMASTKRYYLKDRLVAKEFYNNKPKGIRLKTNEPQKNIVEYNHSEADPDVTDFSTVDFGLHPVTDPYQKTIGNMPFTDIGVDINIPHQEFLRHDYDDVIHEKKQIALDIKQILDGDTFSHITLAFNRGIQNCLYQRPVGTSFIPTLIDYPLGAVDDLAYTLINGSTATQSIANYSLHWGGTKGLYNLWWKDWANFLKDSRPVKVKAYWSVQELLDIKDNITSKFYDDGTEFIIKSIRVSVNSERIESITVDLATL